MFVSLAFVRPNLGFAHPGHGPPAANFAVETIDGAAVPSDAALTIQFARGGAVNGNGGCNSFGSQYEMEGANIRFGPLRSTRRSCPPRVMALESAFFAVLDAARRYSVAEGGELIKISDGAG
ncbi:MAG: META domain-containing protein, partial [Pseudomonadota bacterium]